MSRIDSDTPDTPPDSQAQERQPASRVEASRSNPDPGREEHAPAGLSLAAMAGLENDSEQVVGHSDNTNDSASPAEPGEGGRSKEQCNNCHVPLQGPFCHRCGQPSRHFIRFFPVVVNEIMVDSLGIDGRFWRTLLALLFRPGRLTLDYLSGRRVHYSPPIRLYLFSSLLAFLIITNLVDDAIDANLVEIRNATGNNDVTQDAKEGLDNGDKKSAEQQAAADEIERANQIKAQVAAELSRQGITPPPELLTALDSVSGDQNSPQNPEPSQPPETQEHTQDDFAKTAELYALPVPQPPDVEEEDEDTFVFFGSEPWDAETNPVELPFLSEGMNQRLNHEIGEFKERLPEIKKNPRILVDRILEILPQAMFLMLPAFALLMKLFYAFSRRFYMEHLLFALHNHAFVYAMVSLMALTSWMHDWLSPGKDWDAVKSSVDGLSQLWIFVYLFLAQKRVYRQGWIMTTLKFFSVGICYSVLLTLGMIIASLVGIILV